MLSLRPNNVKEKRILHVDAASVAKRHVCDFCSFKIAHLISNGLAHYVVCSFLLSRDTPIVRKCRRVIHCDTKSMVSLRAVLHLRTVYPREFGISRNLVHDPYFLENMAFCEPYLLVIWHPRAVFSREWHPRAVFP